MEIRERVTTDVDGIEGLADRVRRVDGYPPRQAGLFSAPETLIAWVAHEAAEIIGHVAINREGADEVMRLAAQYIGRPPDDLAVVARLLVAPSARRHGVGRELVGRAVKASHDLGRWPILDVSVDFGAAIGLYESCGWIRAGAVTFMFRDDGEEREARSLVYVGPPSV